MTNRRQCRPYDNGLEQLPDDSPQKPFKLGIIVGRFQTLHTGHGYMIEKALAICEKVGIFIGSSQESGTEKNPFSYELRKELITNVFGNAVTICPLPDIGVGNTAKWGEYVLDNVKANFGQLPDLMISGKESRRTDWFEGINGVNTAELFVPKTIEISASVMRQYFIDDRFDEWKKYTAPVNWSKYEELRDIVLSTRDNHETASL